VQLHQHRPGDALGLGARCVAASSLAAPAAVEREVGETGSPHRAQGHSGRCRAVVGERHHRQALRGLRKSLVVRESQAKGHGEAGGASEL